MILALINIALAADKVNTSSFVAKAEFAWETTHKDFSTTRSPCLDALLVNFKAAGCKGYDLSRVSAVPDGVAFSCRDPETLNGWTLNPHVVTHTKDDMNIDISGWDIFCFDPTTIVFIPENPRLMTKTL